MVITIRRAALSLFALLLVAFPALAQTVTGKVVGVTDGDTIRVVTSDKKLYKIRLNGVDCPESNQAYGQKAKQFTSAFSFGKTATVNITDTDRYGRSVASVKVGGKDLNQALVKEGLAWWYRKYAPADKTLKQLEYEARVAKRNIWSDKSAVAPWDFRNGKTSGAVAKVSTPRSSTAARRAAKPSYTAEIGTTVYATATGSKYHEAGCRHLRRSQIPMSLKEAEAQGLTPCKHCH